MSIVQYMNIEYVYFSIIFVRVHFDNQRVKFTERASAACTCIDT